MSINENAICRDIANLDDNIFAAGVIANQELVARYSKIEDPPVTLAQLKLIYAQPEILISICKNSERFFGNLKYLLVCFDHSDFFFFPENVEGSARILYVRTKRTFRGEEILQKIYDYLRQRD